MNELLKAISSNAETCMVATAAYEDGFTTGFNGMRNDAGAPLKGLGFLETKPGKPMSKYDPKAFDKE